MKLIYDYLKRKDLKYTQKILLAETDFNEEEIEEIPEIGNIQNNSNSPILNQLLSKELSGISNKNISSPPPQQQQPNIRETLIRKNNIPIDDDFEISESGDKFDSFSEDFESTNNNISGIMKNRQESSDSVSIQSNVDPSNIPKFDHEESCE